MPISYSRESGGKSFDVDWMSISTSSLKGEVNFDVSSVRSPRKVTGLDKMVQKWLYLFMLPAGSDVFEPELGTDFYFLREASISDKGYVSNILTSAIGNASEQMLLLQGDQESTPDDERFLTAEMINLSFGLAEVDVTIKLVNAQGSSRVLTLPSPFKE